ncbi:hypothetical protein BO99DRAFT_450233 [Aspergillus violaceofuscus CBS 115571]|uniref:Altered inheritance of mitochondria protein 9, mitochondrial n=1 Tax=Aspergillus violaceofuscus (strain CBS 115571) TaxID=1450538 RepID=A0A2V5H134_ASPV1|nr:hypothetical protein BO99DRAFT_450233 [Aspergillus violaceofuscus CBS 115571]
MEDNIADPKHELEALSQFTSGRWLWNERQQLPVAMLATSAIGSRSCTQVVKVSEGQYNKVFQLIMDDGREMIAKLPSTNAGRPHCTTASEVRNFLSLPVPRVYAWSSRASENSLGAEYIFMEKQAGVVLSDVWDTMKGKQKVQIVYQVVDIERRLAATRFSKLGSLYYQDDLANNSDAADATSPLYLDSTGNGVRSKTFGIGPTNHRSFFDLGRGALDIERGLWSTAPGIMAAVARREMATTKAGLRYPLMPEGLFHWPRQYQPSLAKKLSALANYLQVAPRVLPANMATHASVLWHGDLHSQHIMVDPQDPGRIVGILDWQSVSARPLFMQNLEKIPLPPGFDSMGPDEQQRAKALHLAQSLHNLYLVRCLQRHETVFHAIRAQDTLRHQVSVVPGLVLMDYEPLLSSLLTDVKKEWAHIVGVGADGSSPRTPFPLRFLGRGTPAVGGGQGYVRQTLAMLVVEPVKPREADFGVYLEEAF